MNTKYTIFFITLLTASCFAKQEQDQDISFFDAARLGDLAKVEDYIKQKTDVNAVDADGYSPLMYAAASLAGFEDTLLPIAKKLLKAGANPNIKTENGETALTLIAAFPNHIKVAQELIKNGADVNALIKDSGMTPLMTAAANNNLPLVKVLAKKVKTIDQQTPSGISALIFAAQDGQPEMVALLLKAGADKNSTDNNGNNALITAARTYADLRDAAEVEQDKKNGYLKVIKLLLKAGSNRKQKNNDDMSFNDYAQSIPELDI